MKFNLSKVYPKYKNLGEQEIKITGVEAVCFKNGGTVARLVQIKAPQITVTCIYLYGLESIGFDRYGCERFIKQEWQLTMEE